MTISLYEHNRNAYHAVLSLFETCGNACVIHPTGTGKSFIGFKLCEEFPKARVCWLSPSERIFKTQIENLAKVTKGYFPKNIVFFTYARLMNLTEQELLAIQPDYIILDEFHRVGAKAWGSGVKKIRELFSKTPVLGLSATAIRYLDNQRDMVAELFDGNIASEMTVGEAIVRGILEPPKYISSIFSYQKDLSRYEKRIKILKNKVLRDKAQQYLDALRRTAPKADGLENVFHKHMGKDKGKYIVFCANYRHMQEMISKSAFCFSKVDDRPNIYSVYSDDPTTSQEFEAFKKDKDSKRLRLLYCIDALNEGIHLKDISGVILFRPTVSPIIYKQQIGRALVVGQKGRAAKIFDIVNNFENLCSINAIVEEMKNTVANYRFFTEEESIVHINFEVIDEVKNCKRLFQKLEETLSASWCIMYEYAKQYYKEKGNLEVSRRYKTIDGYALGNWIATQRKVRSGEQYGSLTEARIEKLDAIGMVWEKQRSLLWERNYTAAKTYAEKFGHLDVPNKYCDENGVKLGKWIAKLRIWHKTREQKDLLTENRIKKLEEIGMVWSLREHQFEEKYNAARAYFQKHGNLIVPSSYYDENGIALGAWIRALREKYKAGDRLGSEQKTKLDKIGMLWDCEYSRRWEEGYLEAKGHFEKFGNLDIRRSYCSPTGYKLGDWVSNQRETYQKGKLKLERKMKLDKLGIQWGKDDPWGYRYDLVKSYYEEHGNIKIPAKLVVSGVWLNKWLNEQKQIYRGNRKNKYLEVEQVKKLEKLGIAWHKNCFV